MKLTELVSLEPFDDRPVRTVHGVVTLDQLVTDLSDRRPAVHRQTVRALVVVVEHQPHLPYRSTKHQLLPAVHSKTQSTKLKHFSTTFQGPKLHFSSTKVINKKPYPRRGHSKFRLQCDTEVYCTVLTNTRNDKSKISKVARFKFDDFSGIFKYFQAPYLFSSTFNGLEVFIPNSSIFTDFSSTLWTLTHRQTRLSQYCASLTAAEQ